MRTMHDSSVGKQKARQGQAKDFNPKDKLKIVLNIKRDINNDKKKKNWGGGVGVGWV